MILNWIKRIKTCLHYNRNRPGSHWKVDFLNFNNIIYSLFDRDLSLNRDSNGGAYIKFSGWYRKSGYFDKQNFKKIYFCEKAGFITLDGKNFEYQFIEILMTINQTMTMFVLAHGGHGGRGGNGGHGGNCLAFCKS